MIADNRAKTHVDDVLACLADIVFANDKIIPRGNRIFKSVSADITIQSFHVRLLDCSRISAMISHRPCFVEHVFYGILQTCISLPK